MSRRVAIVAGLGLLVLLIMVMLIGKAGKGGRGTGSAQADNFYETALALETKGELEQAAQAYQELIRQFPNFKQIDGAEKRLWDLNFKMLLSPMPMEKDVTYKVEPADTLSKIADKYNTTVELIMASNNLPDHLIRPGKRLKISPYHYSVIVDKSQSTLTLKADQDIFKVYQVATGKYNCTPTGTFKIVEKLKDPDWYKPGEGVIPAQSPKNILGTRWLGLSEEGYGIHGGAQPQDLTKQVTDGCIRMTNADAEELFTILPRGTEVTIVD